MKRRGILQKKVLLTKALKAGRWAAISYMQHPAKHIARQLELFKDPV